MKKEIKLIRQTEEEYTINWMGYVPECYDWVNNHHQQAVWVRNTHGSTLIIRHQYIREILLILTSHGYTFNAALEQNVHINSELRCGRQFTPRSYQVNDAEIMIQTKKIINASEMGTGKTATAILACAKLKGPVLIICPAALTLNWIKEINMIDPLCQARIWTLSDDPDDQTSKYTVVSYNTFTTKQREFNTKYECVILDEAHYIKALDARGNPGSLRAAACLTICERTEYVFLLTGTPMPSYTRDLYNLLLAIDASDIVDQGFRDFALNYCDMHRISIGRGKYAYDTRGTSNSAILYNELKKVMIRHNRSEVLPGLTKLRQYIPITVKANNKMIVDVDNFYSTVMCARHAVSIAKTEATIELASNIISTGGKVVIVCCFLDAIKQIGMKIKNSVQIIGEMSADERMNAIEQFQAGDANACILSLTAGGIGITLTAASTIIFNDFDFVPANMLQAEDRICRIGQREKVCNVYYIVADNIPVDRMTAELVREKMNNINAVIDNGNIINELLFQIKKGEKNEYNNYTT